MSELNRSRLLKAMSVALAVIILLCATLTPKADAKTQDEYYENALLFWTNVERERNGLSPLKTTDALDNASETRAKELITKYDHTRPNGKRWTTIFAANGISYGCAAENIAVGYKTPCEVVGAWMESSGHRSNILSSKFKYMGSGYSYSSSGYKHHWEQLFAGEVTYQNARSSFYVAPKGLSLDKSSITLSVNGTAEITGTPNPVYATEKIICQSSDTSVVQVTGTQVNVISVKGLRNGTATLTFKCGSYSKTVSVTVGTGVGSSSGSSANKSPYVDVSPSASYYDAVIWATNTGITRGIDATHFSPNSTCTRGQAMTFLWRAAGCPEPKTKTCPFVDVSSGSFCYKAVLWAVEKGITLGTDSTHFSPNKIIPKEQAVMFLYRYYGSPTVYGTEPYSDVKTGSYCYSAVLWAYKNGIADSGSSFGVGCNCSRAQIVQYLYRAMT